MVGMSVPLRVSPKTALDRLGPLERAWQTAEGRTWTHASDRTWYEAFRQGRFSKPEESKEGCQKVDRP